MRRHYNNINLSVLVAYCTVPMRFLLVFDGRSDGGFIGRILESSSSLWDLKMKNEITANLFSVFILKTYHNVYTNVINLFIT